MPSVNRKISKIPPAVSPARMYWASPDGESCRLYRGDVLDALRLLPAKSVQCVITSPPYWGLRDYGTGMWEGGDLACDHAQPLATTRGGPKSTLTSVGARDGQNANTTQTHVQQFREVCGKCGARRTDRQIGSEPTPAEFVAKMVEVFREVRRVLRDDGTLWLNLGDSYASRTDGSDGGRDAALDRLNRESRVKYQSERIVGEKKAKPLPSGNLVGIPWRVALALQADGWVLRQDIIWCKPSPMPESVRNRCTKAHEYVFLLTKGTKYFYDAEAIRESARDWGTRDRTGGKYHQEGTGLSPHSGLESSSTSANKRSVWTVASAGFPGAHFATFPPKLIEPMIKAGTSEYGCCAACGAPWERVVERVRSESRVSGGGNYIGKQGAADGDAEQHDNYRQVIDSKTVSWRPTCECYGKLEKRKVTSSRAKGQVPKGRAVGSDDHTATGHQTEEGRLKVDLDVSAEVTETVTEYVSDLPLEDHPVVPCVVLDPFVGSGTTPVTAIGLGRRGWGIDLSEEYLRKFAVGRAREALRQAGLIEDRASAKAVDL